MFRVVFFSVAVAFTSCFSVSANTGFNYSNYDVSGNIYVFDDLPNVAWLIGEILEGDYYNLRQIIRDHEIQVLVLDSPGGNLYESLQMAAMVHDRGIDTYVPNNTICESACANIFFAGASRLINGYVGVHQFSSNVDQVDEENVQLTVADIIGFLNEFDTPAIVFEKMFQSPEMFYFSGMDFEKIGRVSTGAPVLLSILFVEEHIVEIYENLGFEPPLDPTNNELTEADILSAFNSNQLPFDAREQSSEIALACVFREDLAVGEGITGFTQDGRIYFSIVSAHGEYEGYQFGGSFDFGSLEPIPEPEANGITRYYAGSGVVDFRETRAHMPSWLHLTSGLREETENIISWLFWIEGRSDFNIEDDDCYLVLSREK